MSPLDSLVTSVSCGISKRIQPRRIMLFEIKILVLTITLISFSLPATADIIVQPGYGKVPTQHLPIHSQSLLTPIQRQRESGFGHTQAQLIPIYSNGQQGGAPYQVGRPLLHYPHYPHYPSYPQYTHAWPRYALPQKHLRVLKLGGRKVFQPSWFVGQPSIPLAVHHRYKKSIGDEPDSEKSWESVPSSKDSTLDKSRSDMLENGDKPIISHQSKNDVATTGALFGLKAAYFMNSENHEAEFNTLNERNTDENNKSSTKELETSVDKSSSLEPMQTDSHGKELNSQIPPDVPNLRNFPDPRPDTPEHKTSHKTTSNPIPKNSQEKNLIVGSPMTGNEIHEPRHVQQEYPISLTYYHDHPLYDNYVPPLVSYLPVYVIRYGACSDGRSKMYGDQQSAIQEQIHQTGAIHATDYLPNMGYASSPQTYNYVPNYASGHPMTFHYASSPYPIPYAQFK